LWLVCLRFLFSVAHFLQSQLLLDAFNKDRAALLMAQGQPAPAPASMGPPPDPKTQELINEKLKKAEELGLSAPHLFYKLFYWRPLSYAKKFIWPSRMSQNVTYSFIDD
jgi:hypothetical protein